MKPSVAIVGGGACALMLGCALDPRKFEVAVYERNTAPGRKFLVAGEGGLNLTHSENEKEFITRYTPAAFFEKAFLYFSNKDLVGWINGLGVETYVGSSGRVFPKKGIKPVHVLNTLLGQLKKNKVGLHTNYTLKDFSPAGLVFENKGELKQVKSNFVIFCMGGASWPVTGSRGDWYPLFEKNNIRLNPFRASNCSFQVHWPDALVSKIEGKILKNILITCGERAQLGEVVLTRSGIEGSGIYPFSPVIKAQLDKHKKAAVSIDFKPNLALEKLVDKIKARPSKTTTTEYLKAELHLSEGAVQLLKHFLPKEEFLDAALLAAQIKCFKIHITGTGPVDEAISTTGGVDLSEINAGFQLKQLPQHYVIGEMLDYDAPTGGYLLQSCFSMAAYLAAQLNTTSF